MLLPVGPNSDHAMLPYCTNTAQNDQVGNSPCNMTKSVQNEQVDSSSCNVTNSPPTRVIGTTNAVPDPLAARGGIYEDVDSEDTAVGTPVVATAFTEDGRYSNLQRDSPHLTQSTEASITTNNVEMYYGSLDISEQYIVSCVLK